MSAASELQRRLDIHARALNVHLPTAGAAIGVTATCAAPAVILDAELELEAVPTIAASGRRHDHATILLIPLATLEDTPPDVLATQVADVLNARLVLIENDPQGNRHAIAPELLLTTGELASEALELVTGELERIASAADPATQAVELRRQAELLRTEALAYDAEDATAKRLEAEAAELEELAAELELEQAAQ